MTEEKVSGIAVPANTIVDANNDVGTNKSIDSDGDSFDSMVDRYSSLIGLNGNSYQQAIKGIFYSVLANQLKYDYFTLGKNRIDLRINILAMLKSGYGKKDIEQFVRGTIGEDFSAPIITHVNQLIGKVRYGKKGEVIEVPGYLHRDFIIIDDAESLLMGEIQDAEEIMHHVRTALDPIGSNTIEVGSVDVPLQDKFRYNPHCTIALLSQPIPYTDERLLHRGSFRRFLTLFFDINIDERKQARRDAGFNNNNVNDNEKLWEDWHNFNSILGSKKIEWIITKSTTKLIDDYIDALFKSLNIDESKEAFEYTDSLQFNIKINIFKMAAVRAICNYILGIEKPTAYKSMSSNIVITEQNVKAAINDYDPLYRTQTDWIRRTLVIRNDKPVGWQEDKHGIISNILKKYDNIERSKLLDEYCKRDKSKSRESLTVYLSKILKDFVKWNFIKVENSEKNYKEKIVRRISFNVN